jgi:hypothetical protein
MCYRAYKMCIANIRNYCANDRFHKVTNARMTWVKFHRGSVPFSLFYNNHFGLRQYIVIKSVPYASKSLIIASIRRAIFHRTATDTAATEITKKRVYEEMRGNLSLSCRYHVQSISWKMENCSSQRFNGEVWLMIDRVNLIRISSKQAMAKLVFNFRVSNSNFRQHFILREKAFSRSL